MANPPKTIDLSGYSTPASGPPETIPLAPTGQEKVLQNTPDDTDVTGTLKNLATSIIKGLPHIPHPLNPVFYDDLNQLTAYLARRIHSATSGIPMERLAAQANLRARQRGESGDVPAPLGDRVVAPILERTGEYKPTSDLGRIGSTAVQGASAMGPMGPLKGLISRILMGGGTGAAGETATEYTGDPLYGIAASSMVPKAASSANKVIQPRIAPYLPGRAQSTADARLLANTRDPQAALAKLNQNQTIIPGSEPSTAEATMDPGHIIADKLAKTRSTQYQQGAHERVTQQNTARRAAIDQNADASADPVEVSNQFRKYVDDVDAEHQARVDDLQTKATQRSKGIEGADLDETGKKLRADLAATQDAHYRRLGEAYDAIDPDKKLNVLATPVTDKVQEIINRPNRDLDIHSPLAEDAINKAAGLKNVVPFERLRALDTALTKLMAQARRIADPGYNDIVSLKGAVKDAFANAVENQVKYEADLVARGEMRPEDTFASKLAQQRDAFYADKERAASATAAGQDGSFRPGAVPPKTGATARPGAQAGGEGLSPNLEPDTAQRLAAVNRQYGEFRSLYGAEPLAGSLKTTGFKDQFKIPDAQVAAKAFPSGDAGYNATSRWLEANPEGLADIKSIAVGRLREMMKGETLTPDVLNAWRTKYAPALKAIDEASPGFSDNFNTAASTGRALNRAMEDQKAAVAEAQKGVASQFLKLNDPSDIIQEVGKVLNGPKSGLKMGEMIDRMQGNDAAMAGLRKAAVDWMLGRSGASNAGVTLADENILSFDAIDKLMSKSPDALRKLFGDEGFDYLQNVTRDMRRSQQVLSAQATPGSDTASKLFGKMLDEFEHHTTGGGGTVGEALNLAAAGEIMTGEPISALKIKMGQALWEKAQGFLDARRAAGNAEITRMMLEGLEKPEVAKVMLERAIDAQGKPNLAAFTKLYQLLGMTQQAEEGERRGRASGGSVSKIDYAAKAAQLVRMADKAKKAHAGETKSLLKYPDQLIAGALRLANQEV